MKKTAMKLILFLLVLGVVSTAQADSYSFEIESGGLSLTLGQNYDYLTLSTTDVVVFGYDTDYPGLDTNVDYDYDLTIDGSITYTVPVLGTNPLSIDNTTFDLGVFQGIDLNDWITPGGTATYDSTTLGDITFSAEYEGLTLTDASLSYFFTVTDDPDSQTLSLYIDYMTLTGDNLDVFMADLLNMVGLDLSGIIPFTSLSATASFNADSTATLDAKAVPVPAGIVLLGSGLLGLASFRRRR